MTEYHIWWSQLQAVGGACCHGNIWEICRLNRRHLKIQITIEWVWLLFLQPVHLLMSPSSPRFWSHSLQWAKQNQLHKLMCHKLQHHQLITSITWTRYVVKPTNWWSLQVSDTYRYFSCEQNIWRTSSYAHFLHSLAGKPRCKFIEFVSVLKTGGSSEAVL